MARHLSYANAMATIAVFIALGGGAYAVTTLPKNSVTTIQVKNGSLLAKDFKKGQLKAGARGPAGPQGAQGPQGLQGVRGLTGAAGLNGADGANGANGTNGTNGTNGVDGSALGFANVGVSGLVGQSKNVTSANVTHTTTGEYCFNNLPFTPKNAVVTKDILNGGASFVSFNVQVPSDGAGVGSCPNGQVVVDVFKAVLQTVNNQTTVVGQLTDVGFYILFN